jgi:hypothetical protein
MDKDTRNSGARTPARSWFFRMAHHRQQFHIALAGTVGGALARTCASATRDPEHSSPAEEAPVR